MISDYYKTDDPLPEVVSLADMKAFLRVRNDADDSIITALTHTAVDWGQNYTGREFGIRTFTGYFSDLDGNAPPYYIYIRRAPLWAISSLEIYQDGAYIAFTDYQLRMNSSFSKILFINDGKLSLNKGFSTEAYPIKVFFNAGYNSSAPEIIKTAVKTHTAFLYENRGDAVSAGDVGVPKEVTMLYRAFRINHTFSN